MNRGVVYSFFLLLIGCFAVLGAQSNLWTSSGACAGQSSGIDYSGQNAMFGDGSGLVLWTECQTGSREIYGQRFLNNGSSVWESPLKISDGYYSDIACTTLSDGNILVAWTCSTALNDLSGNVRIQKINPEGQLLWDPSGILILGEPNALSSLSACVADSQGGGYVVFMCNYAESECCHFDNQGNLLWDGEAKILVPADETSGQVQPYQVCNDGQDGIVAVYTVQTTGWSQVQAMRISAAGDYPWGENGMTINSANVAEDYPAILQLGGSDGMVVAWAEQTGSQSMVNSCRIATNGTVSEIGEWQCTPGLETYDYIEEIRIARNGETQPVVCFLSNSGMLYLNRWGGDSLVTLNDEQVINFAIVYGNEGEGSVAWSEYDESDYTDNLYLSRIDANGTPLWTQTVVDSYSYEPFSITSFGDNTLVTWSEWDTYLAASLKHQLLNQAGEAQWEDHALMRKGLDFQVNSVKTFSQGDDVLVFWSGLCSDGFGLHLQVLNTAGEALYPMPGLPLLPGSTDCQSGMLRMSDGNFLALYADNALRVQLISPQGELLWGEDGVTISDPTDLVMSPYFWVLDDGIRIVWCENRGTDSAPVYSTRMQCLVNGVTQWEQGGREIFPDYFSSFKQGMLSTYNYREGSYTLYLFSPEGVIADDWPQEGVEVGPVEYHVSWDYNVFMEKTSAGYLFVYKTEVPAENYVTHYYGLLFDETGRNLWEQQVDLMGEMNLILADYTIDENGFTLYFFTFGGIGVTALARYDYEGQNLWNRDDVIADSYMKLHRYLGGNMLFWNQYSEESGNMDSMIDIVDDSNSQLLNSPFAVISAPVFRYVYNIGNMPGNKIVVAFRDYRSGYYYQREEELVAEGLYLQCVDLTGVSNDDTTPDAVTGNRLFAASPNPFNPTTWLRFSTVTPGRVSLKVYNLRGQLVRTLTDGYAEAGMHELEWNGCDNRGKAVASGVYLYRLTAGDSSQTRKCLLLK